MHKLTAISNIRYSHSICAELRASHAGETGAVWIYRGILLVNWFRRDRSIEKFAQHHLSTEKDHLMCFENLIHRFRGSGLLLVWIIAGFMTGVISMLLGRNWVYYTIYKVETFVDVHYQRQINTLANLNFADKTEIIQMMAACNADEQAHRDEALHAIVGKPNFAMRIWGQLVSAGSHVAVVIAKFI
jgi:ubiquinone biosynthesis monooxygenase Coq7